LNKDGAPYLASGTQFLTTFENRLCQAEVLSLHGTYLGIGVRYDALKKEYPGVA